LIRLYGVLFVLQFWLQSTVRMIDRSITPPEELCRTSYDGMRIGMNDGILEFLRASIYRSSSCHTQYLVEHLSARVHWPDKLAYNPHEN
ncbi:hypothetical protein EDD16DRAFT_1644287, partial [Pisolithus croceorrhizus]